MAILVVDDELLKNEMTSEDLRAAGQGAKNRYQSIVAEHDGALRLVSGGASGGHVRNRIPG